MPFAELEPFGREAGGGGGGTGGCSSGSIGVYRGLPLPSKDSCFKSFGSKRLDSIRCFGLV